MVGYQTEVVQKRELDQNYIVVSAREEWQDTIAAKMLEHNQVMGLMPFEQRYFDNQLFFYYPVRQGRSLEGYFQTESLDNEMLIALFLQLITIWQEGERFFLGEQGYLLDARWMYWDSAEGRLYLCYVPGLERNLQEDVMVLVEYLMGRINGKNRDRTELIYRLYDALLEEENVSFAITSAIERFQKGRILPKQATSTGQTGKQHRKRERVQGLSGECGLLWEGDFIPLETAIGFDGDFVVGRGYGCGIRLPFAQISRRHALLSYNRGKWSVMDFGSVNGTYVNGKQVKPNHREQLCDGDEIVFGNLSFRLALGCKHD